MLDILVLGVFLYNKFKDKGPDKDKRSLKFHPLEPTSILINAKELIKIDDCSPIVKIQSHPENTTGSYILIFSKKLYSSEEVKTKYPSWLNNVTVQFNRADGTVHIQFNLSKEGDGLSNIFVMLKCLEFGKKEIEVELAFEIDRGNHTDISSITSTVQPTSVPGPGPTSSRVNYTNISSNASTGQTTSGQNRRDIKSENDVNIGVGVGVGVGVVVVFVILSVWCYKKKYSNSNETASGNNNIQVPFQSQSCTVTARGEETAQGEGSIYLPYMACPPSPI